MWLGLNHKPYITKLGEKTERKGKMYKKRGSFNYSAVLGLIYPNASFQYLPAAGSGMYTRDRALTLGPVGNYADFANAAFFVMGKTFATYLNRRSEMTSRKLFY